MFFLQDYSSNIEHFYHSENEMTDDDIDIDTVESSSAHDLVTDQTLVNDDDLNANYNNDDNIYSCLKDNYDSSLFRNKNNIEDHTENEIPDLLKNVTNINNNNDVCPLLNYSDTDIENNFHTKDIIGDFNKEIEQEIKQLFNYSININDDLEELRKDINDSLAKPIENTINNISEIVNHVIKKLVETKSDPLTDSENSEVINNEIDYTTFNNTDVTSKENELNLKKEMNLSRPSYLLFENKDVINISDAFLSNAKDDINMEEYDTERMSNNVENTIKQLSTELRKIIPKLDELREFDKVWSNNKVENSCTVNGNLSKITSKPGILSNFKDVENVTPINENDICMKGNEKVKTKHKM